MSTIGAINSPATVGGTSNFRASSGLTADQKSSIKSVLGKLDSKNLSSADAKKITSEFKKLGIQPGKELEEAMAASGFDARQVGDLAFGHGQQSQGGLSSGSSKALVSSSLTELKSLLSSIGTGSTVSSKSDEEISQATDDFLKMVFAQAAESRTSSTSNRMPQGAPPPGGPQGGNRPPPPAANNNYQDASDIETYLSSLIASLSAGSGVGSDSAVSGASTLQGASQMVQSASSLLKTSGMDASSENLQSFMQILQKNITASMADKGNLFDQSV
jgi:hypothetical protein